MTALTDRIEAVLRLHGDLDTRANADYLAGQITEALGLTEERGWVRVRQFGDTVEHAVVGWIPVPSVVQEQP